MRADNATDTLGYTHLVARDKHAARPEVSVTGGRSSHQMVSRYARGNAGERSVKAHKTPSPGGRLNFSQIGNQDLSENLTP